MTQAVLVAGVGMVPFAKPGASDSYDVMGANAIRQALSRCRHRLRAAPTGLRRLRLRRFHLRAARALRSRHDRHPGHQRQQQLLDRLDRAVPGAAGRGQRRGRLRAGASASSRCSPGALGAHVQGPAQPVRALRQRCATRCWSATRLAAGAALLRRRRARRTCSSTARSWRPSPRSAPRPAAMPRTTRWRCSARSSPKTR